MRGVLTRRLALFGGCAGLIALSPVAAFVAAGPAGAAPPQRVRCVGTGDFCGATVGIAGRTGRRVVTVALTDTNFKLVGVQAIPSASRTRFSITGASFRLGGSQFRFTLMGLRPIPRGARIILLFAAGGGAGKPAGLVTGSRQEATVVYSVGAGMKVDVVGGGPGSNSNCVTNETRESFTTAGNNEPHVFGFTSVGSGSCAFEQSVGEIKVTVSSPNGQAVGSGKMLLSQATSIGSYSAACESGFTGKLTCKGVNPRKLAVGLR